MKRSARRAGRAAILATIVLAAPTAARADVYGYVDAGGAMHLATERIDERYTLFIKAGDGATASRLAQPAGSLASMPAPTDPALEKTRLFQRLVGHPNIVRFEPIIAAAASRHGLDPQLVKAVIAVESGFEPSAVSEKGAVGLMQVLPATGERYGVRADRRKSVDAKLTDPVLNLEIGTRYLADLRKLFPGRPDLVLAAYNAGENAVVRRNAIPPYPETQAYVKLVDQFHAFYNPRRSTQGIRDVAADSADTIARERIRVTIPARRNLPDPSVPLRILATPDAPSAEAPAASITVPPPRPADGGEPSAPR